MARSAEWYAERDRLIADPTTCKVCKECGTSKLLAEFNKKSTGILQRQPKCKKCESDFHYRNRDRILSRLKAYGQENRSKISARESERIKSDPLFKAKKLLRTRICNAIRRQGYSKDSSTWDILGADFDVVYSHLVSTAQSRYGQFSESTLYHIDHIIPCDSAETKEDLIRLQHYTNLQYLTPEDNLQKSNKIDWGLS